MNELTRFYWRISFTPRVKDAFKQHYQALVVKWGYERDDNW